METPASAVAPAPEVPPAPPKAPLLKRAWARVRWAGRGFRRGWREVGGFSRRGWPGAAIGCVALIVLYTAYLSTELHTGLSAWVDFALGAVVGALSIALLGLGIVLAAGILRTWPKLFSAAFLGTTALMVASLPGGGMSGLEAAAMLVLPVLVIGLGVAVLRRGGTRGQRKAAIASIAVGTVALAAVVVWAMLPGTDPNQAQFDPAATPQAPQLQAANPAEPGPYKVLTLFYGSGDDDWRPEFANEAKLKTATVNAKPLLKKFVGIRARLRKWVWGFGSDALPLNGRVWYPEGAGPFPLVLIVHGNHNMGEFSDPGYAYLGELLASRGFITVSVDENFLNGGWMGGVDKENGVRGWILLQHLSVWRAWNEAKDNPFFHKVDMGSIALIGHSRGGEAIAHAAAFNRLKYFPDDARVKFDFSFNIKTLIAIAPIDGQYQAADEPAPLENVNYLVLQGSHDADVSFFAGYRPFRRVKFTDGQYWMKAALYIYRANHGQFNTVWGSYDYGLPMKHMLIQKSLLPGEEQRRVAKTYIAGFLEATLRGHAEYVPMFRDYHLVTSWLPKTIYFNSFEDSRYQPVSDFEKTVDVTRTAIAGGVQEGENLATWRIQEVKGRSGWSFRKKAVFLGWKKNDKAKAEKTQELQPEKVAAYSIALPEIGGQKDRHLDSDAMLVFSIADTAEKTEDPLEEKGSAAASKAQQKTPEKKEPEKKKSDEKKKPVDFTVELVADDGQAASLALSHFFALQPVLKVRFTKWAALDADGYKSATEPVFQTFELPLADFAKANPRFDPSRLKTIRLRFDRTESDVIAIDEIGFARRNAPAPLKQAD